ncbi:MAG: hypothetical protein V5A44_07640 [Haloarculaceae archaeon]
MRKAVLSALVSVVLVTAAGALGAAVVGDSARDAERGPPGPFAEGDGLIGAGPDQSTDGGNGGLADVEDALRIGSSTGETNGSEAVTASSDGGTDAGASGSPDGDGPADSPETDPETGSTEGDADGDGLADDRDASAGSDPAESDTDGDGLLDSWEVAGAAPSGAELPGADPLAKDVYVQFDYAPGAERRGEAFYDAVAAGFAEMAVDNPDNSSGIDVHVRDGGTVNESVRFTGENFWTLKDRHYESELGARAGVYRQVLVVGFTEGQVGYGEVGGHFSVVASGLRNETAQRAVTHELLHNVVGRVEAPGACADDPKHYCEGGYLSPRFDPGEEQYLAEGLARQLERQGFAE